MHSDQMVRLSMAAKIVESITGERPSTATIYRWASRGLAGQKLRTAFAGGHRRTTETWIREFFDAVTVAKDGDASGADAAPSRLGAKKRRAERELDAMIS